MRGSNGLVLNSSSRSVEMVTASQIPFDTRIRKGTLVNKMDFSMRPLFDCTKLSFV